MEKRRKFLTNVFTDSMSDEILGYPILPEKVSMEDLKKEKDLIPVIKEEVLANTLSDILERDIEINKTNIKLLPGDVIYVINPGMPVYNLKEDKLPPSATITIKRYTVFEEPCYR